MTRKNPHAKQATANNFRLANMRSRLVVAFNLVAILGVALVGGYSYQAAQAHIHQAIETQYIEYNRVNAQAITGILHEVENDLRTITNSETVKGLIRAKDSGNIDAQTGISYAMWVENLANYFEDVEQNYKRYSEAAYLDEGGSEIVRVNYDGIQARRVLHSELQNNADLYYFHETMQLSLGQIYVSRFDLNRDFEKIQPSYQPMMHYIMPVFNQQGERRGIIVLNVAINKVIHKYAIPPTGNGVFEFLADSNGYYIHHSSIPEKEWNDSNDLNTNRNLRADFPEASGHILSGQTGQARTGNWEIFYSPIQTATEPPRFWILAVVVPRSIINTPVQEFTLVFIGILVFSLLLATGVGYFTAQRIAIPLETLRQSAQQIAEGDLSQKIQLHNLDSITEVTDLADAFNQMIEELKNAFNKIERRDRYLEQLAAIGQELLTAEDVMSVLPDVLMRIGRTAKANHAYIFRNHYDTDGRVSTIQKIKWSEKETASEIVNLDLQDFPLYEVARWVEILRAGKIIDGAAHHFPLKERALLESQGICSILAIPIFVSGEWWGLIRLDDCKDERDWSHMDQEMLRMVASLIGQALTKSKLLKDTRRHVSEFAILYKIAHDLDGQQDVATTLQSIVQRASALLNAPGGAIYLYDSRKKELEMTVAHVTPIPIGTRLQLGEGMAGRVAQTRQPLIVDNYQAWEYRSPKFDGIPFAAVVQVPMLYNGELVGILVVNEIGPSSRKFADTDARLLSLFATHAASIVHNARLFEAEQEHCAELAALYDLSRGLADSTHDCDDILNLVTCHALKIIQVTFVRVALFENGECIIRASHPARALDHDLGIGRRESAQALPTCHRVAQQGEAVVICRDSPTLTEFEREALFVDIAQTLCLVPMRTGEHILGLLIFGEARSEERGSFTPEKIRLARSISDQAASALHRAELFAELERAYLQTVLALANAVDAKDTYTADHAERLAKMALAVGREMGLSPNELESLHYGAILHDVGKIGVPDAILKKPDKLDANEWKRIRQHPVTGAQIIAPVLRLTGAAHIVRHHHERYDGKGYPDRLAGDEIPIGARILAVVDAYSAIIDKRIYKEARLHKDAVTELKQHAGAQFDPHVVDVFLRIASGFMSNE